jgi:hypothetical protein
MMLHKIKFYGSISIIYLLTLGTIGSIFYSSHLFGTPASATPQVHMKPVKKPSVIITQQVIAGRPIRIIIPSRGIDLKIDQGSYDPASRTWTLSQRNAEFALISEPANNIGGLTFIYGHGTDAVFGKIGTNPPSIGSIATIYTDNGHIFTYVLDQVKDHNPSDTDILKNPATGPPRLVIQTCTGIFSQWRTMFTFSFKGVL